MIFRVWFLLGSIICATVSLMIPVTQVSANGVVRPVWEQQIAGVTLIMRTSPFPLTTGPLHIALRLDPTFDDGDIAVIDTPVLLTISPGQVLSRSELVVKIEDLKLYKGALGQYHANVFIERSGEWIFTVDLVISGKEYTLGKMLVFEEAQLPKVPLLAITFVVLVFGSGYLAWWIRSRNKSVKM